MHPQLITYLPTQKARFLVDNLIRYQLGKIVTSERIQMLPANAAHIFTLLLQTSGVESYETVLIGEKGRGPEDMQSQQEFQHQIRMHLMTLYHRVCVQLYEEINRRTDRCSFLFGACLKRAYLGPTECAPTLLYLILQLRQPDDSLGRYAYLFSFLMCTDVSEVEVFCTRCIKNSCFNHLIRKDLQYLTSEQRKIIGWKQYQ